MDFENCVTTRREFVRNIAIGIAASALTRPLTARSRDIPAVVSPDWLSKNLGDSRIVVIDIRTAEQYKKGHIPGAINVPMALWAVSRNGLSLELPLEDALSDLIKKTGMNAGSHPVIVSRFDTDFNRADTTRVAWTCAIAGIENAAILDGGHNRWVKEIKTLSTEDVNATPSAYALKMNQSILASKRYVLEKIGKAILVDTRLPEEYFGVALKPGHIKSAVNLPTPWVFAGDGTFRNEEDLLAMASGVIGTNKSKEVILYCGFGGYACTWWFLLTQIFGYQNVSVYDGSMEEWVKDPADPVSAFSWH
jgi:thiosulfate/3-mercaptopyruvate sulfurtransferase